MCSPKIKNKTRMSALIDIVLEVLARAIRQENKIKLDWKGRVTLSIYRLDDLVNRKP